jgi:hypothetical protein
MPVIAGMLLLSPTSTWAQAAHSWVSGVGDDTRSCSRAAPCRTFAGALAKTAAGGEISCVDSGAFGPVTIGKSIAIVCAGVEAGVSVPSGDAIKIDAAAGDVVFLSGLDLDGRNSAGTGVSIVSARTVRIADLKIRRFEVGVAARPLGGDVSLELYDTMILDSRGDGINISPSTSGNAKVSVMIDAAHVSANKGNGITFINDTASGAVRGVVNNSVLARNGVSGVIAASSAQVNQVLVDRSTIFAGPIGIAAFQRGALVRFANSRVFGNQTGVSLFDGGFAISFSTNDVVGNGNNGLFGTTTPK